MNEDHELRQASGEALVKLGKRLREVEAFVAAHPDLIPRLEALEKAVEKLVGAARSSRK